MTIDEAIAKYKEITNTDTNCPGYCNISCDKCVQESRQLVEWLEDYKSLAIQKTRAREKAIDECLEIVKFHKDTWDGIEWAIKELEDLKEREID